MISTLHNRTLLLVIALLVSLGLTACGSGPSGGTPTLNVVEISPTTAAATNTPEPTDTPMPLYLVLLASEAADPVMVSELSAELSSLATQGGYRFQVRPSLSQVELEQVRLVVALSPNPGLLDLVAAGAETQFLAVGFTGLETTPNLSVVAPAGERPDQVAFLAGYTAAVISDDYRTGVISEANTVPGMSIRLGYINGVTFFCGLCRPAYPPFPQGGYPLAVELAANAGPEDWSAAVTYLRAWEVQTVFVQPALAEEGLLVALSQGGIDFIVAGNAPAGSRENWVATLGYQDPLDDIRKLLPAVLEGQGEQRIDLPLGFSAVNPDLLSPGRQGLVERMLADLLTGYIDTGVDPLTGEGR